MYEQAWGRIRQPRATAPGFFRQSNWFRVGPRYATALAAHDRKDEARRVPRQIRLE